ncbi:MAG: pantetheine-phosphate adenylyltransferase [Clostridiales bacterium]|nr:pantetheine-phosphate adenylyltransferase [Clostridiales bacterium]
MQERIAVVPGSFDPVTLGHIDIIRRAAALFDRVIVLVVINPVKNTSFTPEERVELIRKSTADIPGVEVDLYKGLLVDYVRSRGAVAIVKGLRAMSDFEYEFQMALINKKMLPYAETVFLTTGQNNLYLSSSLVKNVAMFGGDISGLVPRQIHDEVVARLSGVDSGKLGKEALM